MPPQFASGLPPGEGERQKQIGRTKTGILLLLIGALIGWVPRVAVVGSLFGLVGAILVILGRKPFGPRHTRNVMISIIIFVVGFVGTVVLLVSFTFALVAALSLPGGGGAPAAVKAAAIWSVFINFLLGTVILSAIVGLASVFFTYALQNPAGRILLWSGYGSNVAVSFILFVVVAGALKVALLDAASGGPFDVAPILAVQSQLSTLTLLTAIPAVLFAGADYIAWTRIKKGEIPAPAPITIAGEGPSDVGRV